MKQAIDLIRLTMGIQAILLGVILLMHMGRWPLEYVVHLTPWVLILGGAGMCIRPRSGRLLYLLLVSIVAVIFGFSNILVNYALTLGIMNTATVTYAAELVIMAHIMSVYLTANHVYHRNHGSTTGV